MRPSACIGILVAAALGGARAKATTAQSPSIRNVYTFPDNTFIENIAVRSNSRLLVTSMSVPSLFAIDPTAAHPAASVIHTFPNTTGITGIAEIAPDIFALVTGVWNLAETRAQKGSQAIWTVDFTRRATHPVTNNQPPPVVDVNLLAVIQNATMLNGIVRHPTNPRLLLVADSALGAIWRVDLSSGAHDVAFASPLLAPTGSVLGTNLGINGIKAAGAHVYFTNSAQRFFGRLAVDGKGNLAGPVHVIANHTGGVPDVVFDDIALNVDSAGGSGEVWIAAHPSQAVRVSLVGGSQLVIDAARLLNSTSAAFGRGSARQARTLYVTNGGEPVGNALVNGGVVAIDLSR